jgi:putative FmdB family regulatory protein
MALYEYRCREGHISEVFHPMGENPAVSCETCEAPAERVLSTPMIHTQYYFSPQVHGARRPRHQPSAPGGEPNGDSPPAIGARAPEEPVPKASS